MADTSTTSYAGGNATPEAAPATSQEGEVAGVSKADRERAAIHHGFQSWGDMLFYASLNKQKEGLQTAAHIAETLRDWSRTRDLILPVGLTPWLGGKDAPADWDGGQVWLRRGCWGFPVLWDHTAHDDDCLRGNDVIGYRQGA